MRTAEILARLDSAPDYHRFAAAWLAGRFDPMLTPATSAEISSAPNGGERRRRLPAFDAPILLGFIAVCSAAGGGDVAHSRHNKE
ncbi:MAG: hypothetical protein KF768_00020 [Phycisphaeraceae bacterium]|nr:hypothetical protein [Phycisphaeraceae bacterium]